MVDALVAAVRAAYPRLSHRYYALKAQWFGKKTLPHWDRNAPLPKVADAHHRLERGARHGAHRLWRVLAARWRTIAERFFDERWIDAPVRPGKAPGAFAHPTVPSAHPYVLLNYQGKPRDVMTLAHELGHGVHQVLAGAERRADGADAADARRDRERVRRDADLPEAARRDHRHEAAQGHARRQGRGHDQHGGAPDRVLYLRAQGPHRAQATANSPPSGSARSGWRCRRESLGPAIELKPGYETFWAYIPHFIHSPFYVYAYAFGDCLVNSLYAVYEKRERRLRRALSRDARGRRHQASFRTAGAVRPRRARSRLLAGRA